MEISGADGSLGLLVANPFYGYCIDGVARVICELECLMDCFLEWQVAVLVL